MTNAKPTLSKSSPPPPAYLSYSFLSDLNMLPLCGSSYASLSLSLRAAAVHVLLDSEPRHRIRQHLPRLERQEKLRRTTHLSLSLCCCASHRLSQKVFGGHISALLHKEGSTAPVPRIVQQCVAYIREKGIYSSSFGCAAFYSGQDSTRKASSARRAAKWKSPNFANDSRTVRLLSLSL